MILTWYYYFSYWIFIWFLLFKLGFIPYSPYLIYLLTITFIIIKGIRDIWLDNKNNEEIKNKDQFILWILLTLIVDIIPFFYLKPKIDNESILFTLVLISIYLIFMDNSGINVYNHYKVVNYRELSTKYDLKTFIKQIFCLT